LERLQQLNAWLVEVLKNTPYKIEPASADASFRRYFRVTVNDDTFIAMDAPPPQEDCAPFVHVAKVFADAGLNVPKVIAQDIPNGFLLLSDLGNTTFLTALQAPDGLDVAADLYRDASNALVTMQLASKPNIFPEYDEVLLSREMALRSTFFVGALLATLLAIFAIPRLTTARLEAARS
jgi:aminoglycoside/choline kinase family phosphotransferase